MPGLSLILEFMPILQHVGLVLRKALKPPGSGHWTNCQLRAGRRGSMIRALLGEFRMKLFSYRSAAAAIFIAALLPVATVHAQLDDLIKKGQSAGSSGGAGSLGSMASGLSGQSLSSGSTGNVAGLLQYCISNNFVQGDGASSIQNKLMGKLPGGSASSDPDYKDGAKGLLKSSDGKQLDLSGEGLKAKATKQVCDQILSQAKSML
jgi:hypothetical protein